MKVFKDRSVMSKTLGILIVMVLLSGAYACSKPGSEYVGIWEGKYQGMVFRFEIAAAGNNQFFIIDTVTKEKDIGTYKDGVLDLGSSKLVYAKKTDTLFQQIFISTIEYKRIK